MSAPHIHGGLPSFSVSRALEAIGEDIAAIRKADGLTWKEVGRVLGKSDDRAADYSTAMSEMPLSAFLLGCREWNGRFGGRILAMIGMKLVPVDRSADPSPDRAKASSICRAQLAVSVMLEDEAIDDEEIRQHRAALVQARDDIDALLARIGPKDREDAG